MHWRFTGRFPDRMACLRPNAGCSYCCTDARQQAWRRQGEMEPKGALAL